MSVSRSREARLLDAGEADLVGRSHHPALGSLDDRGLSELLGLLRERRDRARDVSRRQRREARGKPVQAGARAASGRTGLRETAGLLAAAAKRVSKESERRRFASARETMVAGARRALALKKAAGDPAADRPSSRTAGEGMHAVPNEGMAPSGALGQEGQEIAMRRGGGPR